MVVTREMEKAVKDQDTKLILQGVVELRCLAYGSVDGDSEIARDIFGLYGILLVAISREGENVGCFVLATEAAIEFFEALVVGEKDSDLSPETDGALCTCEEAREFGASYGRRGMGGRVCWLDDDQCLLMLVVVMFCVTPDL